MTPGPDAEPLPAGVDALDQLATMVALVRPDGRCLRANAALEDTMGQSRRALERGRIQDWLREPATFQETLQMVVADEVASGRLDAHLSRHPAFSALPVDVPVHVIVSRTEWPDAFLVELIPIEQQTRLDREERTAEQAQAGKELIRNLAHEIKNPLGGIRGAAQLLALEFDGSALQEYTQVIIHEADRLQALVDRLLAPHRRPQHLGDVNVHEICERVRTLVQAQYPRGLTVVRDYDTSIPEFRGDREQLIQAVLNIAHNATQAMSARIASGDAELVLRTRIVRQATIGRQRFRLALDLHIQDNGPGVPEEIRDRMFQPLVSGRDGGTGLGLTLAQTFVQQHQGTIECDSMPGRTLFKILIPLP